VTDCSNVFKAFIGSAMIGLPFAVSQSGILLCIIGIIVIAAATDHCCHLIVKCKRDVIKKIISEKQASGANAKLLKQEEEYLGRTLSFGSIAKACVGRGGLLAVNISVAVTQFGFTTGYFIFLGNTLRKVIYQLTPNATAPLGNLSSALPPLTRLPSAVLPTTAMLTTKLMSTVNGTVSSNETFSDIVHKHLHKIVQHIVKEPFTPHRLHQNDMRTFAILVVLPIPLLVLISFVRNVRKLGPVSVIANVSLTCAFAATAAYMLAIFRRPHESIKWVNFATFPVFFGQVTGAFEGIGTVIPIEGSMAENRRRYPCYLHISILLLSLLLAGFSITGYLTYGHHTHQIITENLQGPISVVLQILLFIGVLFTYPLQIYPVIEITEAVFLKYRKYRLSKRKQYERMSSPVADSDEEEKLITDSEERPAIGVKIKTWEGNLIRAVLICITAAVAIVFREMFAFISALTGSIGSSLLLYILPCVFHISLKKRTMSRWIYCKNILIIIFGVVGGVMGVTITLMKIYEKFKNPDSHIHA